MAKGRKREIAPRALVYKVLAERTYEVAPYTHPKRLHPLLKAPSELAEGAMVHDTLALQRILHTHVANEGMNYRIINDAIRQGMRRGWPDYWIGLPSTEMFIELKLVKWSSDWKVYQDQLDCIQDIRASGRIAEVAWGADHLLAMVAWQRKRQGKRLKDIAALING